MIAQITPDQLAFWRALLAPFADHELSVVPSRGSKKELTYLDKRALENRLDTVCGPHGWYPEYEATARGYKCRLHLLVSMANGSWVWMHKEDGAGFEEMGSLDKQTGEREADVDNDEKSGYTNALRRAAQDAWGIGRYLYQKGVPLWLDLDARPLAALPASAPLAPRPRAEYDGAPAPQPPAGNGPRTFDNFKIPRPGKAVFAWAKEMEKEFETQLTNGMKREAINRGYSPTFTDWDEAQVQDICTGVINFVMTLPTYKGQFDHMVRRRRFGSWQECRDALGDRFIVKR